MQMIGDSSDIEQQNYSRGMQRLNPEHRADKNREVIEAGVYTLKISNFNQQIELPIQTNSRYSIEEKIMRRREIVQTPFQQTQRESQYLSSRDRRVKSSHEVRHTQQLFGKLEHTGQIRELDNLSPLLKEKISELRSLMYRKSMALRQMEGKDQNIHFTQYVMVQPAFPTVLHSRNKKQCSFMKSVKAKRLMSKSVETGKKPMSMGDSFNSIELRNGSKYASSKKIQLQGGAINSKSMREARLNSKSGKGRGYSQKRMSKQVKGRIQLQVRDECRPWQTHQVEDEHNLTMHI